MILLDFVISLENDELLFGKKDPEAQYIDSMGYFNFLYCFFFFGLSNDFLFVFDYSV